MTGRKWFTVLALGGIIVALGAYVAIVGLPADLARATDVTPEDAVKQYLSLVGSGRFERALSLVIEGTDVGTDPATPSVPGMPLEEAEAKGLVKPVEPAQARQVALETLERQRQYVIDEFGPDAWLNASFTLHKTEGYPDRTVWVDRSGNEIDETTALSVLQKFWEDVAKVEGINPSKIIGLADRIPPGMKPEELAALKARAREIARKYQADVPVRTEAVQVAETYRAEITFGNGISASGASNFVVFVSNRSGMWRVHTFQWVPFFPPPKGDI